MMDPPRPKRRRHNFLADVESLRSLARSPAKPTPIHQKRFAIGSYQQQRVSLSYIDRLNQQRIFGAVNRSRRYPRNRSEIVVPVFGPDGKPFAVLDVDSYAPAAFDEVDQRWLERIVRGLEGAAAPRSEA